MRTIIATALVMIGLVLPCYPQSLNGYWNFDNINDSMVFDYSGYGNHGLIKGEPIWVEGIIGNALELNGLSDYIEIPDDSSLDMTGSFTLTAWIYPYSFEAALSSFVNKYPNYVLQTGEFGPRRLRILVHCPAGDCALESDDSTLTLNQWQHVAGTWDGEIARLYINGDEVANRHFPSLAPSTNDRPLYIGVEYGSWQFFNGIIDEVRVYNRTLSEFEIKEVFTFGTQCGDANGDGVTNVGDVVYLINYVFKSGPRATGNCCQNVYENYQID